MVNLDVYSPINGNIGFILPYVYKNKVSRKIGSRFYVDLVAERPFFKLLGKWKTMIQFTESGSQIIMSNVAACQS